MKKTVSLLLTVVLLGAIFSGCAKKEATVKETKEEVKRTIKFGTLPAESALPIIIAKEKGFFEKAGVDVELVPFNSPNDRNVAVQAGKVDGIIADVMTSLTFHEGGFPMKVTSDINEDFKLLTSPKSNITSFEGLNNKGVSIVPNFVLEYIMDKMAEKNNIKYNVVSIPSIPARFEALLTGTVSAVIFTEPQASMLKEKGAKVLATSSEYNLKAGTILFNEKVVNEQPKALKAFYQAYNEAVDYANKTKPEEYSSVLAKYGFPQNIEKYISGNGKYTKADKITDESFKSVLEWCKKKGMVKKDYKFEDISNFQAIK